MKRSKKPSFDGHSSTYWIAISDKTAREKVCQALRERGPAENDIPKFGMLSNITPSLSSAGLMDTHQHSGYCRPQYRHDGRIIVNEKDVLLGRGGVTNSHCGNQHYRSLVRSRQKDYLKAAKLDKAGVAMEIVEEIIAIGGRFLVQDRHDGQWVPVSIQKARDKTSQALREKAPQLRTKTALAAHVARREKSSSKNREKVWGYSPPVPPVAETRDYGCHQFLNDWHNDCLLSSDGWAKLFESTQDPVIHHSW